MHRSLVIIDDFLDNAAALRRAALRLDYPRNEASFPGRNSVQRVNIPGLAEEVSHILDEPLRPLNPPQSHGKFRITFAAVAVVPKGGAPDQGEASSYRAGCQSLQITRPVCGS